jgi:hypothetical protein
LQAESSYVAWVGVFPARSSGTGILRVVARAGLPNRQAGLNGQLGGGQSAEDVKPGGVWRPLLQAGEAVFRTPKPVKWSPPRTLLKMGVSAGGNL